MAGLGVEELNVGAGGKGFLDFFVVEENGDRTALFDSLSLYGWAYANKVANAGLISLMNPCRKHILVSVLFGDAAWIANFAQNRLARRTKKRLIERE